MVTMLQILENTSIFNEIERSDTEVSEHLSNVLSEEEKIEVYKDRFILQLNPTGRVFSAWYSGIVLSIGLIFNSFTVAAILKFETLRNKPSNVLIFHLALSDILSGNCFSYYLFQGF